MTRLVAVLGFSTWRGDELHLERALAFGYVDEWHERFRRHIDTARDEHGRRRSIYVMIRRSQHLTMFDLFDTPMMEVNQAFRRVGRAAYGQAGRAPDPYTANQTYTVVKVAGPSGTVSGVRTVAYGNPGLEPEREARITPGGRETAAPTRPYPRLL